MSQYAKDRYSNKKHNISDYEWAKCKEYFNNSCAYCGMNVEIHKSVFKQDLHRDHVDCNGENDLSNCVPACKECNCSKKDNEMFAWYLNKDYYHQMKLTKIRSWLNGDYLKYMNKSK